MSALADPAVPVHRAVPERMTPKALWALAITSVAVFMVTLDNLVVTTAIPVIRQDLHAGLSGLQWTVNAYTLTFAVLLLTGAALGDRFGRRRLLAIGIAIFTAASAGGRAGPVDRCARRRSRAAGCGRRDRDAVDADRPLRRGAGSAARAGAGHLGRHQRSRPSPSGRWSAARSSAASPGTGSSGSTSRSGSCSCRSSCCVSRRRADRRPSSICPAWPWAAPAWSGSCGPWSAPTTSAGPRRRSSARSSLGGALLACLRRVGAAHGASDAPDALLPQPDVRAGQRRQPVHVLRDVRLDLLHRPVLPNRAGPLAASVGAADPALDGDADARRADRRRGSPTASAASG